MQLRSRRGTVWPVLVFVTMPCAATSVPHRKFRHCAGVALLSWPLLCLWHAVHDFQA